MRLKVKIEYKTRWGESVVLRQGTRKWPLAYSADGLWLGEVARFDPAREYGYEIETDGRVVRREWRDHILHIPDDCKAKTLSVTDRWIDRPEDAPFYSSAFTKAIFGRRTNTGTSADRRMSSQRTDHAPVLRLCGRQDGSRTGDAPVLFQVTAADIRPDEVLAITGESEELGCWKMAVPFDDSAFPLWTLALNAEPSTSYKMVIADRNTLEVRAWEAGENRVFPEAGGKDALVVEASVRPHFPGRQWRGAGTAIPVFSLRTEDDFGVGEFHDLKDMVDWAASTGQRVIQILPINDTTMSWTSGDSYPYNPNSTFALHPLYLHLPDAGVEEDADYRKLQAELNSLEQIDYERVIKTKVSLLGKAFDATFDRLSATADYKDFIDRNASWLLPYAAFCVLRDINGTADFLKWKGFERYSRKKVDAFCRRNREKVDFWCFVQYHLDRQLSEVCAYAHSKGVVFKGDLPIGISRTSVDAWLYPELFHMDSQAGAPPDAFSADGQNWGFPTYDWDRMAEDGYSWWKSRLAKMSEYFDAFRIDHILGFFRIWEIPLRHTSGLEGYFSPALPYSLQEISSLGFDADADLFLEDPRRKGMYHPKIGARDNEAYRALSESLRAAFNGLYEDFFYHRNNEFWKEKAMQKLPALLDSTGMLACGEDLGMIPATVPDVMSELRILSLEIQRMPKMFGKRFADTSEYPYLSVCTTSTHDMNPIRAWWEEDRQVTSLFYTDMLGGEGEAPLHCGPCTCRQILGQHLDSPAMLTILPLQDWLSMEGSLRRENPAEERINIPADPHHYWRYRMHLNISQLSAADEFNASVRSMIFHSGR